MFISSGSPCFSSCIVLTTYNPRRRGTWSRRCQPYLRGWMMRPADRIGAGEISRDSRIQEQLRGVTGANSRRRSCRRRPALPPVTSPFSPWTVVDFSSSAGPTKQPRNRSCRGNRSENDQLRASPRRSENFRVRQPSFVDCDFSTCQGRTIDPAAGDYSLFSILFIFFLYT